MNVQIAPQVNHLSEAGVRLQDALAGIRNREALARSNRRTAVEYSMTVGSAEQFFNRVAMGATMARNVTDFFRTNFGVEDIFSLAGRHEGTAKVATVGTVALLNKTVDDHLDALQRLNAKLDKLEELNNEKNRQKQTARGTY